MFSNRFAFAALGLACIAAAAGGGYLATRHNVAEVAAPAAQAATTPAPSAQPVQETEAVVGDAAKPAPQATEAPAPEPAAPPVSRRSEPASRASARTKAQTATARNRAQEPPALERSWPSGSAAAPTSAAPAPSDGAQAGTRLDEHATEAPPPPEPPAKTFDELVVSAGSVIGLQTETPLTTERSRVEDRVEARVVRDVRVGGEVAIPAGTRATGSVVVVERGGKFKDRARLGIRFHTLTLADGTSLPISTETIYREGDAPGNGSAAKIGGGAVAGAILGAILGGGKGAAVGATAGAGAGTATVMAGDRSAATFPAGSEVTARILSPVTVTVER